MLAATVWMAPNGDDETGDGSKAKPVATLQKAVDLTRKVLTDEDKKIVVKDGATFLGFRLTGGTNKADRALDFTSFCALIRENTPSACSADVPVILRFSVFFSGGKMRSTCVAEPFCP